ncbi:MAG: hypothetical protein WC130_04950 [Kiritimatiellia bacterium]
MKLVIRNEFTINKNWIPVLKALPVGDVVKIPKSAYRGKIPGGVHPVRSGRRSYTIDPYCGGIFVKRTR